LFRRWRFYCGTSHYTAPEKEEKDTPASDTQDNDTIDAESSDESSDESADETSEKTSTGISEEFKESVDAYEDYMDDYIKLLKKYEKDPTDLTILEDYAKAMEEYDKRLTEFDDMDQDSMSSEEVAYYLEVQARVLDKLSKM
jgi:hypothetical protein